MSFNGRTLAEKQSNGTWTDYIYANGQKIARVDGRIHTHGVFTASGNELNWSLPIPTNPDGSQYTIQTGDKLCVTQYNNNAVGGPAVFYSDGSMSTWDGRWTDQNNVEMNQMSSPNDKWVYRCADVSLGGAKTGQTLRSIGILTDVNTQAGTWDIYYADMAIISTDDTVRPVIGPNPPTPGCCGFQGTGWTQTPTATVEAQPDYAPDNVTVHYFIPDQIGSSWMETSNGGWPMWRSEYYPFGTQQYNLPTANNYKFATLERDSESNLDHATFRQYTPLAGRWMSPDPYNGSYDLNNPQSFNRYTYALNNPLRFIDPSGLKCTGSDTIHVTPQGSSDTGLVVSCGFWDAVGAILEDAGHDIAKFFGFGDSFNGSLNPRAIVPSSGWNGHYMASQVFQGPGSGSFVAANTAVKYAAIGTTAFYGAAFVAPTAIGSMGTADVAIGFIGETPHAAIGVDGVWMHGLDFNLPGQSLQMTSEYAESWATRTASHTFSIPVPFPEAVLPAEGAPAFNCITGACSAVLRGWIP